MEYLLIIIVIAGLFWLGMSERMRHNQLKKNGIKVPGVIIANSEKKDGSYGYVDIYQLGGNINQPTVKFITQDGQEITGYPILGFVTQHEVVPPLRVIVSYDPKKPERFCIDFA